MSYKIIKIILILIPIITLAWLINRHYAFGGELVIKHDFSKKSAFISELYPSSRIKEISRDEQGRYYQSIINEPVYFDLKMPRTFDQAVIRIKYKNSDIPIWNLGVQQSPIEGQYLLKPVENKILDQLIADKIHWSTLEYNETIVIQRNYAGKNYETVKDFLNNLPQSNLAVYHYDLNQDYLISGYKKASNKTIINQSIRGSHQIYTYIKDEPLDFIFTVQDINRHSDSDNLKILVSQKDKIIYQTELSDDGYTEETGPATDKREVKIFLPSLAEGVYKIDLQTTDDLFIRRIETSQKFVVFKNKVYLAESDEYSGSFKGMETVPAAVYSNGKKIIAETSHMRSLQTLEIAGQPLDITKPHQKFKLVLPEIPNKEVYKIIAPKNDVMIITNGVLSFSSESFFDPLVKAIDETTDVSGEEINYIVANYASPEEDNDFKTAYIDFDLTKCYKQNNKIRFVFSIPEISDNREIQIYEIAVFLKGKSIGIKEIIEYLF